MKNRLEDLRCEIEKLISMNGDSNQIYAYSSHMYGVSKFCAFLAIKRNLNVELAATCGMLHDIYDMTGGSSEDHAVHGAEEAKAILKQMNTYSDDEINIVATAISRHSDKEVINEPYDELLKDADVMDHCFYNNDFPVREWEAQRYNNLLIEFGIDPTEKTLL